MQDHYDRLESMTDEERRAFQESRLRRAVTRAFRGAPAAREMMLRAGVKPGSIKTVADLEKLPVTRKPDLIEQQQRNLPYGEYYIGKYEDIERVFISPGPVYEPLHGSRIKWFAKSFWAAGFRRGDTVINTFTYHLSPAGTLFGEALRQCGATVVVAGAGNTDVHIKTMKELSVNGFVGTPSYLLGLINKIEETGNFNKDFGLKKAWFTGEMLSRTMRRSLEQDYGIDTYQAYAVTEPGGALAYECPQKDGLHLMDDYIIEIIDPATGRQLPAGEIGEIVVTPLHNPRWGLLRFGTGDLSRLVVEDCPCGRTAPKLGGLLGRCGDAVKVRGMFVVPKQVRSLLDEISGAGKFQLKVCRQGNRDHLTLRVETERPVHDAGFETDLSAAFQRACVIKLDYLELVAPGDISPDAETIIDERVWD